MRTARDGALALATELRRQNSTAATTLRDEVEGGDELSRPGPAQIAAGGPRAAGREAEYELLIEMIHEGSRLHYGGPRVIRDDDRNLALLLGDQLYAMGLSRLAEIGDLEAVAELADLISLLAQVQAESANSELVEAIWRAGCAAVGCGSTREYEAAKALARTGDERALDALRRAGERPVS
jgi:PBS lyase HEAT-like repeat